MVEHVIGNDGVVSPILTSGTIKKTSFREVFFNGFVAVGSGLTSKSGIVETDEIRFKMSANAMSRPVGCVVASRAHFRLAAPFLR